MKKIFGIMLSCWCWFIPAQNKADINILETINGWNSKPSIRFSKALSNSEEFLAVAVPVGIAVYGLIDRESGALRNAATIGSSVIGSLIITQGMKYAIKRPRPYVAHPDRITAYDHSGSSSFPSSHTSTAFALATSLSLEYPKWYVIAPSFLWASGVAYSRMNLGMHYPTDVLAGMLIGAGSAYLSYRINKWWRKKHDLPSRSRLILQSYATPSGNW